MRWSQYFIPTLREDPADAEVVSHKLLLRANFRQAFIHFCRWGNGLH